MSEDIVLRADGLSRDFGGVHAVREVSLQVRAGERRLILGPNGAGKSVLFSLLGGQLSASAGSIHLLGRDITRMSPYQRARLGLSRTFQLNSLFPKLTVRQNVDLAVQAAGGVRWSLGSRRQRAALSQRCEQLLLQWQLVDRADTAISLLSYGERRRLEVILSLAGEPKVLLLDEPTAGLTGAESHQMLDVVQQLSRDVTVIMIEHDMAIANLFAEHITVLAMGQVVADGTPADVRDNELVRHSYLGH